MEIEIVRGAGITIGEMYPGVRSLNTIAIGQNANAIGDNSIAIGTSCSATEDHEIHIGTDSSTKVIIGRYNVAEMFETIAELRQEVTELKNLVERQAEIIDALWYHPGMPGANAAKESYHYTLARASLISDANNPTRASQSNLHAVAQDEPNPHHPHTGSMSQAEPTSQDL